MMHLKVFYLGRFIFAITYVKCVPQTVTCMAHYKGYKLPRMCQSWSNYLFVAYAQKFYKVFFETYCSSLP